MAQILTINFCQPEQKGMLAVSNLSDCALKYHLPSEYKPFFITAMLEMQKLS